MFRGKIDVGHIVLSIVAVTLGAFLAHANVQLEHERLRPAFTQQDQPIIELSFQMLSREQRVPVRNLQKVLYPVVLNTPRLRCVQLAPTLAAVGGYHVYCFDRDSGSLNARYHFGE